MNYKVRTSWQVTWSVWHAMFMREILARATGNRMAWFWMLFEPIAVIGLMVSIRTLVLGREQVVLNAEFIPWLIIGLMGFFLFRDNMMRLMGAVDANRGLFAYRQVKPIDSVIVRSLVEGSVRSFVFLLFIAAGMLLGMEMNPDTPLLAIWAWFSLWMFGFGIGLTLSAVNKLVPELGNIARLLSLPLLLVSGVIIPFSVVPYNLREYFLWNPIPHGLETLREGFFSSYPVADGVDLLYLWYWILVTLVLGLILHLRYEMRLKAK
ncbi:ABC transporter permease [Amphritea sp. 2_MG-2023]|uniref:ABC transporter permease n=1 Tax=Amphritea TaxID=515417 RepID=UPI001C06B520|nr:MULTISPECIES: ABC transporter permease [Amphritea]MBU2964985.1 ABC transporter permease [Amphritea atlantica]MDO6419660.1 ABC transporter permease [Amphritea sp. 2_MG-2023]